MPRAFAWPLAFAVACPCIFAWSPAATAGPIVTTEPAPIYINQPNLTSFVHPNDRASRAVSDLAFELFPRRFDDLPYIYVAHGGEEGMVHMFYPDGRPVPLHVAREGIARALPAGASDVVALSCYGATPGGRSPWGASQIATIASIRQTPIAGFGGIVKVDPRTMSIVVSYMLEDGSQIAGMQAFEEILGEGVAFRSYPDGTTVAGRTSRLSPTFPLLHQTETQWRASGRTMPAPGDPAVYGTPTARAHAGRVPLGSRIGANPVTNFAGSMAADLGGLMAGSAIDRSLGGDGSLGGAIGGLGGFGAFEAWTMSPLSHASLPFAASANFTAYTAFQYTETVNMLNGHMIDTLKGPVHQRIVESRDYIRSIGYQAGGASYGNVRGSWNAPRPSHRAPVIDASYSP